MELKEIWNTSLIGVVLIAVGCSTAPKQDTYGPSTEEAPVVQSGQGDVGPAPVRQKGVVVLLSGSGARAFAGVGVLKELAARKVEVTGLVGTGWGGLIAVLYAKSKSINEFEWMMTRLRDSMLVDSKEAREELRDYLQKTIGTADLRDLRRPVVLVVHSAERADGKIVETGRAALWALATSLSQSSSPELKIDGDRVWGETARPYPVAVAKQLSRGPVVGVDLGIEGSGKAELSDADMVIRPDFGSLTDADLGKRSSAMFKGGKAVREQFTLLEPILRDVR